MLGQFSIPIFDVNSQRTSSSRARKMHELALARRRIAFHGPASLRFSRPCWSVLYVQNPVEESHHGKEVEVGELLMKNGMQCWKIKVLKVKIWTKMMDSLGQILELAKSAKAASTIFGEAAQPWILICTNVLVCLCCGLSLPHSLKRWAAVRTLGIFAALLQASAMCVDSWLSRFLRISHWAHEGPGFANAWTLVQTRSTKWVQWYGNPGGLSTCWSCWWTNLRSTHQR